MILAHHMAAPPDSAVPVLYVTNSKIPLLDLCYKYIITLQQRFSNALRQLLLRMPSLRSTMNMWVCECECVCASVYSRLKLCYCLILNSYSYRFNCLCYILFTMEQFVMHNLNCFSIQASTRSLHLKCFLCAFINRLFVCVNIKNKYVYRTCFTLIFVVFRL